MDDIINILKNLDFSQILTLFMSAAICFINLFIVWLKTKKSALQKKLLALQNETLNDTTLSVLNEFYILTTDNLLIDPKDVKWIPKDSVSVGDYLSYQKGGTLK